MFPSHLLHPRKLAAALLFLSAVLAWLPVLGSDRAGRATAGDPPVTLLSDRDQLPKENTFRFLPGLGYGPFREGQNPDTGPCPTRDNIRADMPILARLSNSIRTFGVTCVTDSTGIENICRIANDFGLRCMPTAWLGPDAGQREREINKLVEVARASPNIDSVMVGNETLHWRYVTTDTLIGYINRVKQSLPGIPVTTGEPPYIWDSRLIGAVDFVTINVYPYWEPTPIPIDQAASFVVGQYDEVRRRSGGKRVVIGETGWPSAGATRSGRRGDAVPSLANQRRFLAEFSCLAAARGISFYYFEAFDESWKRRYEGEVGAHWGIYTKDRAPKHPGLPQWGCASGTLRPLEASIYMEGQYYLDDAGRLVALLWPGGIDLRSYVGRRITVGGPYSRSVVDPSIPVITVYGLVPLGLAALPKAKGPPRPSIGW